MARLRFNDAQNNLYGVIRRQAAQGKPVRLIVLKGRQEGISTVTEGLMFQDTVTRPNVKTLIVAHENTATANLFKMNKLFYDSLPPGAQPMRKNSNAKELVFENPTKDEGEAPPAGPAELYPLPDGGQGRRRPKRHADQCTYLRVRLLAQKQGRAAAGHHAGGAG